MSKKHLELLQVYNNTEASVDRIWKVAQEIWNSMTSSMVARAFLVAYRIMGKIIETNGDTEWLSHGAPHCHVRRDYVDTDRGVLKVRTLLLLKKMTLLLPRLINICCTLPITFCIYCAFYSLQLCLIYSLSACMAQNA